MTSRSSRLYRNRRHHHYGDAVYCMFHYHEQFLSADNRHQTPTVIAIITGILAVVVYQYYSIIYNRYFKLTEIFAAQFRKKH